DMDVLCHDPVYEDHKFLDSVRRVLDLRHREGFVTRKQTIEYVPFEDALKRAAFVSLHVALTRPGESDWPTYHLMDERRFQMMKPTPHLLNTRGGPVVAETAPPRRGERRAAQVACRAPPAGGSAGGWCGGGRVRRLREGAAARRQPVAR